MLRKVPETTHEETEEEKRARIKFEKEQKRKNRLQTAQTEYDARLNYDLSLWAREHGLNASDANDPQFIETLSQVRHNRPITEAHIKGSKSHDLIQAERRKKGDAARLRRRMQKQRGRRW